MTNDAMTNDQHYLGHWDLVIGHYMVPIWS